MNELLRNIEQSNPGVNASITVCALPLGGAHDGKSFTAAVERLYAASFDQRSQESLEPLVQLEYLLSSNQRFDERRLVLPNAAIPGEYFLAIGQGSSLERPLFDADFDKLQSVGRQRVLEGVDDRTVVFFLAPWDMQHELEQSMAALMAELSPQPRPGNYATAHWVRWPICYAELTSLKAVRLTLQGRTSDCTCQYCKAGAEL